jgi:chaperonin cofactor prefoldin
MRRTTGLAVGLALILAGCDSKVHEQMESEVKNLQARCEALSRENETLKSANDNLKAENSALDRNLYGLKTEIDALKKQQETDRVATDQLKKDIAVAKAAASAEAAVATAPTPAAAPPGDVPVAPAPAAPAGSAAPPGAAPAPVAGGESEAALEKTKADLEARLAALQPKIGQADSRIAGLQRGKVDERMVPPPGGKIEGGQVYRRELHNDWSYYGPYYGPSYGSHYEYVPLGPAVKKHDFRTPQEKDAAIRTAKEEALPLYQERKALQDQLAATKAKLAKLRAGKAGN